MSDLHNLYFIQILQEAFRRPDRDTALSSALEEIVSRGQTSEYREGFENFQKLMAVIDEYAATDPEMVDDIRYEILQSRIIDFLTDTFVGNANERQDLMEFIERTPELVAERERLRVELDELLPVRSPAEIEVEKDGRPLGIYRLEKGAVHLVIDHIYPGEYVIKLSTGLFLWEGTLEAEDIFWHLAFPERKLPAAAETVPSQQKASVTHDLLNGAVMLQVLPGLESAEILLSFKKAYGG